MKTYITHDNGGRPFKVVLETKTSIGTGTARVFKWLENKMYSSKPVYTVKYMRAFVGKSPRCPMTEFSGAYGPTYDGNSILLYLGHDEYVYIGNSIKTFVSTEIVEYNSPVGNNNVPYPYAFTSDGRCHLVIEDVTIVLPPGQSQDPYQYYYNANQIRDTQWFLDDEEYSMRYEPNPDCTYTRLIPHEAQEMSIIANGARKVITRKEYCTIIENFGKTMGFEKINSLSTIVQRLW